MGQPESNGVIIAMVVPFVDMPCGHIICGTLAAMRLGMDVPADVSAAVTGDVLDGEVIPALEQYPLPAHVIPLFGKPRSV